MRISPQIRIVVAIFLAVATATGVLISQAASHEDSGGPERLDDSLRLTELTALTDQDDGLNGLSEYCIRVSVVHPDHIAEADSIDCVDVNWDDIDKKSGKKWQDLEPPTLPLIGPGGYAGTAWESADHTNECRPTAPWTMRVRLTESDSFGLSNILDAIGQALTQDGVAGAVGGKVFLYGQAAKLAAKVLRELFDDLSNLGSIPFKWESGEGDPGGTVPKGPDEAHHFKAKAEKTVTRITPDCSGYSTPTKSSSRAAGVDFSGSPLASASQAAPSCGADQRHILCKRASRARRSWKHFDTAVRRIRRLKKEPGVAKANVKGVRKNLIRLVGTLTRYAAETEIKEARKLKLGKTGRRALAKSRKSFRAGVKLDKAARRRSSPARLRLAVRRYRSAHLRLLPVVHKGFN